MTDLITKPAGNLQVPGERRLTAAEFQSLAEVPAAAEWFANLDNPRTRRAYQGDIEDFNSFIGISSPDQFRAVTRAHVLAWRRQLEQRQAQRLRRLHRPRRRRRRRLLVRVGLLCWLLVRRLLVRGLLVRVGLLCRRLLRLVVEVLLRRRRRCGGRPVGPTPLRGRFVPVAPVLGTIITGDAAHRGAREQEVRGGRGGCAAGAKLDAWVALGF